MVIGFGVYTPPLPALFIDAYPTPHRYNHHNRYRWSGKAYPKLLSNYLTTAEFILLVR